MFEIKPTKGWRFFNLRELWAYRELLYFLIWRGVKVRYKQTTIGIAWAVLQPLAMMLVFTAFFGRLAKIPSQGIPYPLFVLAGLIPWQFFLRTFTESSSSLIADQRLITKVYFPRIIIPLATTIVASLDFFISVCLLIIFMVIYGIMPAPSVIALPIFLLLLLVSVLGFGFWFSALNVEYRDVGYVVPFLGQLLFFLTPVVYPTDMVPSQLRGLHALNPMVGVVGGFRYAFYGVGDGFSIAFVISSISAFIIFLTGILWFTRVEHTFVDTIGS
ncbi:MAG: ABC transporter permease [Deltaproteobacteria bacterium]|nr:ABC transporter permease [Deltaproteobacteria bacterium]